MTTEVDTKQLRNCFGKFATGVTVITTVAADGTPVGLTVNSFSSLSLDPPMILWSLVKTSSNREVLEQATHFVVNVLASDQMDVSNQFARPAEDKFAGIETVPGETGIPLIANTVAHLECRKVMTYEGGDHIIFIGEVEHFDANGKPPLLFASGQYALAARHPHVKLSTPAAVESSERHSSDDFILPLLLRSYWEVSDPFYSELLDVGFPVTHTRILVHLTHGGPLSVAELAKSIRLDFSAVSMAVSILCEKGFLSHTEEDTYVISDEGNDHLNEVHSRAKRYEDEILAGYNVEQKDMLKSMLRSLINR